LQYYEFSAENYTPISFKKNVYASKRINVIIKCLFVKKRFCSLENVKTMSLKNILNRIQDELTKKDLVRQDVQAAMRKCTRLSKTAIFHVHKEELEEAEATLNEAKKLLSGLKILTASYPDLLYMGMVDSAFQEYAEAQIFLSLVKEGCFVSFEKIDVPMSPYILGLADVIGEIRRQTLDCLRRNEIKKAENNLELMETIYAELINLDEAHILVHELRRKCDIARRVLEATRGDVTIEVRRSQLENSIKDLNKRLEAKRKK
jgi:translin